jgi:2-isopropylmalate synthase
LTQYEVAAASPGSDAQGEVNLRLEEDGVVVNGRAVDSDIVMASAKALVDGLNRLDHLRGEPVISEFTDEDSWMPIL